MLWNREHGECCGMGTHSYKNINRDTSVCGIGGTLERGTLLSVVEWGTLLSVVERGTLPSVVTFCPW